MEWCWPALFVWEGVKKDSGDSTNSCGAGPTNKDHNETCTFLEVGWHTSLDTRFRTPKLQFQQVKKKPVLIPEIDLWTIGGSEPLCLALAFSRNGKPFILAAETPCESAFATEFASDCECDGFVHSSSEIGSIPEGVSPQWLFSVAMVRAIVH